MSDNNVGGTPRDMGGRRLFVVFTSPPHISNTCTWQKSRAKTMLFFILVLLAICPFCCLPELPLSNYRYANLYSCSVCAFDDHLLLLSNMGAQFSIVRPLLPSRRTSVMRSDSRGAPADASPTQRNMPRLRKIIAAVASAQQRVGCGPIFGTLAEMSGRIRSRICSDFCFLRCSNMQNAVLLTRVRQVWQFAKFKVGPPASNALLLLGLVCIKLGLSIREFKRGEKNR